MGTWTTPNLRRGESMPMRMVNVCGCECASNGAVGIGGGGD